MNKLRLFYENDFFCRWLELNNPDLEHYTRAETAFLANRVRHGSVLLDIGVGTGRGLESVLGKVSKAYGIDFSGLMLKEARKLLGQNPKVALEQADAESLPFTNAAFDYVTCMLNTYGNFENPDKCLEEMLRVVKPDGEVILGIYSQNALETQLKTYKQVGLDIQFFDKESVYTKEGLVSRRFTREKLLEAAKQHGVQIQVIELTSISYIAIIRKAI